MKNIKNSEKYNLLSDCFSLKPGALSKRYDNRMLVTYHLCASFLILMVSYNDTIDPHLSNIYSTYLCS